MPALWVHVKTIVFPLVSVVPAAAGGVPVAVPPLLAALVSVMADPSQVGAVVGQVTAASSTKTPVAPHVYWVVAAAIPLAAPCVHVKTIVFPMASVVPAAAGGVPSALPPVRAALASVMTDPSQVGAAVGQVTAASSAKTPAPHVY